MIESHPIDDLFPLLDGPDFEKLVEDIRDNGQQAPISLFEGKILEGRNRYRACLKAGVEPWTEEPSISDPFKFVVSKNLHRRHLTPSQRATIAVESANMKRGNNQHRGSANLQTL